MVHIVAPQHHHIKGLIQLSREFAREARWASSIPIGQIHTEKAAAVRLFGAKVVTALVAETDEMAGYVGVYDHPEGAYLSILVKATYRGKGLGNQLVEKAFEQLPSGMVVESWVGEFNTNSLAAMPRMGFELDRVIQDGKHRVHVFVREAR